MQDSNDWSPDILNDIRELNLSYLMVAQHLLRVDLPTGMFRLGIDSETADILLTLSPAQTMKIAGVGRLLCDFRLNDANLLRSLRLVDEAAPATSTAHSSHHITILLAGQAIKAPTA